MMLSSQNVAIVKIPFRSKVIPFLLIAYCFCSHGKGNFQLATVVLRPIDDTPRADATPHLRADDLM